MRNLRVSLLFFIVLTLLGCNTSNNESKANGFERVVPKIFIDDYNVPLVFTKGEPHYKGKELYVPTRQFVEFVGGIIKWDSKNNITIIRDENKEIKLSGSENKVIVDEEGVSYIPLNIIAENLGYEARVKDNEVRIFLSDNQEIGDITVSNQAPNAFTPFSNNEDFVKSSPSYSLDSKGVLVYNYGSNYDAAGDQYNPAWISLYAFTLYNDYLNGGLTDKNLLEKFLIQADWLVNNRKDINAFSVWEYNFDNLKFGAPSPWRSAMANGRVISVMLEAYSFTSDTKYLDIAEKAYKAFLVNTENYGVTTFLSNGNAYYEEVADNDAISGKILNGHVFALSGLYDYWIATGRNDVKVALDKGINAVKNDLEKYDSGFLSYYSQEPLNPRIFAERKGYNTVHVHQLLWLYQITDDSDFLKKALRFYGYELLDYDITAKGSTDPVSHGPDRLDLRLGLNYWSHNELPTWVKMDMKDVHTVSGVSIMGHTDKSTPKDMDILYSNDNKTWLSALEVRGNKEELFIANFDQPIDARYIRVEILNDNGNNNVALDGVGIISPNSALNISDFNNFSISNYSTKALDNDPGTKFILKKDGWLLLDLGSEGNAPHELILKTGLLKDSTADIEILGSDNLDTWSLIKDVKISSNEEKIELDSSQHYKYIKLLLPSDIKWVNDIILK